MGAGFGEYLRPAIDSGRSDFPSPRRARPATDRPAAGREWRGDAARTATSAAPSIVQWPLLCTRGAISLTSGPSAQAKNSTVSTPTWPSASAIASAAAIALAGQCVDLRPGRDGRGAQDAAVMMVAGQRKGARLAVAVRARRSTLNSASKSIAGFGDRRLAADRVPGRGRLAGRTDPGLALAVIAVAAGLEHDRQAELRHRRVDVVQAVDRAPRRDPRAGALEEALLVAARSWATASACAPGRSLSPSTRKRLDRQIFEFVGDDVALARRTRRSASSSSKAARVKWAATSAAQGCSCGSKMWHLIAEPRRGQRHHPAELAAAQYADRGAGRKTIPPHSGCLGNRVGLPRPPVGQACGQRLVARWPASPPPAARH